ncbi:MAG: prephenate dehydrogenase/arogenate dehydrogenase family protein [Actinobacteria bacterium]|nr:prephenate dehydrogenase/arogenate dehydrogenase family protein [Actinomycetota bacterium]
MRVAVLGVGLIGGSIGLAAREAGHEVSGWDIEEDTLAAAAERGAIDRAADSVADAVSDAEVCFVCAPVGALAELVAAALAAAPSGAAVTDVGSTKRAVVEGVDDERFIGGHPIAGSEASGISHARPDLFREATWYLTPTARSSGVLYDRLHSVLVSFGAHPTAIEAEEHDRMVAVTSHLPHVLANVLVLTAAERAELDRAGPRIGPSLRDATRVAGANPAIWPDIFASNRETLAGEIAEVIRALEEVGSLLERRGSADAIESWHRRAADVRRRLLDPSMAGGPVHELRVWVPNRPGIVAQVALALGRGGVNIADMALAPAPDFQSGSITLWIAGDEPAERAAALIGELGFSVERAA